MISELHLHTDIYPIQFKYTFLQQTIINPIKCLGLQVQKKIIISFSKFLVYYSCPLVMMATCPSLEEKKPTNY